MYVYLSCLKGNGYARVYLFHSVSNILLLKEWRIYNIHNEEDHHRFGGKMISPKNDFAKRMVLVIGRSCVS